MKTNTLPQTDILHARAAISTITEPGDGVAVTLRSRRSLLLHDEIEEMSLSDVRSQPDVASQVRERISCLERNLAVNRDADMTRSPRDDNGMRRVRCEGRVLGCQYSLVVAVP